MSPGTSHNIRERILAEARLFGFDVAWRMSAVLANGPRAGGKEESLRHYGSLDRLQEVLQYVTPLVEELDRRVPGFGRWLEHTGFGNDVGMIGALAFWMNRLHAASSNMMRKQ